MHSIWYIPKASNWLFATTSKCPSLQAIWKGVFHYARLIVVVRLLHILVDKNIGHHQNHCFKRLTLIAVQEEEANPENLFNMSRVNCCSRELRRARVLTSSLQSQKYVKNVTKWLVLKKPKKRSPKLLLQGNFLFFSTRCLVAYGGIKNRWIFYSPGTLRFWRGFSSSEEPRHILPQNCTRLREVKSCYYILLCPAIRC